MHDNAPPRSLPSCRLAKEEQDEREGRVKGEEVESVRGVATTLVRCWCAEGELDPKELEACEWGKEREELAEVEICDCEQGRKGQFRQLHRGNERGRRGSTSWTSFSSTDSVFTFERRFDSAGMESVLRKRKLSSTTAVAERLARSACNSSELSFAPRCP
jgi:hypothetical protein